MNKSLLIIGRPHSSKTVFLSQLYGRLQKKKSKMILDKAIGNLTPITNGRKALANGKEPEGTVGTKNEKLLLSVRLGDKIIELLCPEYGGEQIDAILSSRDIDTNWKDAIKNSDNWLFFIRLNSISTSSDVSTIVLEEGQVSKKIDPIESKYVMSDQTALIELLQIFLDTKGSNYHFKNSAIKLTIVLTCWDELETDKKPSEILKERLPLFLNFVEANWNEESLNVLGLAALGCNLKIAENQVKYQEDGPEEYGFVIKQDGTETKDITELIIEAL
jgi:Double-GTPase 1